MLLEAGKTLEHILAFLHREVGYDADDFQMRQGDHGDGVLLPLGRTYFQTVAAHAGRIQRQVHRQLASIALGQCVQLAGDFQVADHLVHAVGQGVFHLAQAGGAQAHQAALEALFPNDAGFLVTGDADAADAHANGRRHQQGDASAIGIGLHHGADLALASHQFLDAGNVVLEGGLVNLQPGIAFGHARDCGRVVTGGVQQRGCVGEAGAAGEGQGDGQAAKGVSGHI
ncbi:hypothetical protein D9M69_403490 [compost metagenome]